MALSRRTGIGLAWVASILSVVLLAWSGGFFYWRATIRSELEAVKRKALTAPKSGYVFSPRLADYGSRPIPYLLGELREATSRGDRSLAILLSWEISECIFSAETSDDPEFTLFAHLGNVKVDASMDELRSVYSQYELKWKVEQRRFPPWWMWWKGHSSS